MKKDITALFIHSLEENYTERLLYDFSHLEHYWKDEMLGVKNDETNCHRFNRCTRL